MAPKFKIKTDQQGPFGPGDILSGVVEITSSKTFEVQNIDIVLECHELASEQIELEREVYGFNGVGFAANFPGQYAVKPRFETIIHTVFNHTRYYLVRNTLFPANKVETVIKDEPIQWSSQQPKPVEKPLDKYERDYTMKNGTVEMPFNILIPYGCPPTLHTLTQNSINWYLNVECHSKSLFTFKRGKQYEIEVYQRPQIYFNPTDLLREIGSKSVKVYLPGYKESRKSFSGFVNNIMQKENEFKVKRSISSGLLVPRQGIPQLSRPTGVHISFLADDEIVNHMFVHSYELSLIRKLAVDIYDIEHVSRNYSQTFSITNDKHLDMPVEDAMSSIDERSSTAVIETPLTESGQFESMNVSYDIKSTVRFASSQKSSHYEKLTVQAPVVLLSCKSVFLQDS